MSKETTSLVNAEAIERNRYYFSILITIVAFLAIYQSAFRRKIDAFESEGKGRMGLLLSLFNYTVEKDQCLPAIIKTIPRNATYTSFHMQSELIAAMSSVVTEDFKQEIGNSWYTIKVGGTKNPSGVNNISLIIHFF